VGHVEGDREPAENIDTEQPIHPKPLLGEYRSQDVVKAAGTANLDPSDRHGAGPHRCGHTIDQNIRPCG